MVRFYSNGKLLLTGEYVVLDGALSLAVPTIYGQSLSIQNIANKGISWKSYDCENSIWFEGKLNIAALKDRYNNDPVLKGLFDLLICAKQLNPNFLADEPSIEVETHLTFNRNWGLGSSSTLINNIASWAEVDAYELLAKTFGGSGYDIACAQYDKPILYQLVNTNPNVEEVEFRPSFSNHLYFVYLNQKQKSDKEVNRYSEIELDKRLRVVPEINAITAAIYTTNTLKDFSELITKHETIIGSLIEQEPVKKKLFSDFNGSIKSLGAWGGDFVLVATENDPKNYFESKGFHTILRYDDFIKKAP
jgi:mevalonate kinase